MIHIAAHFAVYFKGEDGNKYSALYTAENKLAAQEAFMANYSNPVLYVENITLQDFSYAVAHSLLGMLKESPNENTRLVAMLSKPIAATVVILTQEYSHHLHDEEGASAREIAEKIFAISKRNSK